MANEFLPFALALDANVLRPERWAADRFRERGFSAGPARSAPANTVWRQSAFVAAAIAQYIADSTGEDVLDNGDLAGFVRQLMRALGTRRQILMQDLDLYVSTTGDDTNPGTQERPFRTLQAAADYAVHRLDIGPHTVNVRVAEGAYDDGVRLAGPVTPDVYQLNFIGDANDPSRVVVAKTTGTGGCFHASDGAGFTVTGFTVINSAGGWNGGTGLLSEGAGSNLSAYGIYFGACTRAHIAVWNAVLGLYNDFRITDRAPSFILCTGGYVEVVFARLVFLGNPAIPIFVQASRPGCVRMELSAIAGAPAEGTVPVKVFENAVVTTTIPLPGSEAVQVDSGGIYVGPVGVTDGSDGPPGRIGEYIQQDFGPPGVTMTPGITSVIGSMRLPAGDWDITASFFGNEPREVAAISFLTAKLSTIQLDIEDGFVKATNNAVQGYPVFKIGGAWEGIDPNLGALVQCQMRGRISTPGTTLFLNALHGNDSGMTILGFGAISARRVR